jgi:hypothetical protein
MTNLIVHFSLDVLFSVILNVLCLLNLYLTLIYIHLKHIDEK